MITLAVQDLQASFEFYHQGLGLNSAGILTYSHHFRLAQVEDSKSKSS
ncbi:hypothetical protein [Acinetobacter gandensis]